MYGINIKNVPGNEYRVGTLRNNLRVRIPWYISLSVTVAGTAILLTSTVLITG